jgi:hypothetical protein
MILKNKKENDQSRSAWSHSQKTRSSEIP